jgi:hypothetical protein
MKTLLEYINNNYSNYLFEGNIAHKVAKIANKGMKEWNSNLYKLKKEIETHFKNTDLFLSNFKKFDEIQCNLFDKFNNEMIKTEEDPRTAYSSIIYWLYQIKEIQTQLFRTIIKDIDFYKNLTKKYGEKHSHEKIINHILEDGEHIIKLMESMINHYNSRVENIENNSDIHVLVFGDAKNNKKRSQNAVKPSIVYHKDINDFVKKYKLMGLEIVDNRLKLTNRNEIIDKFIKKLKEELQKNNIL